MFTSSTSFGSWSDAIITGPGGQSVFSLRRLDRSFWGFENAQFGIFNNNGEPLIYLSESFEFFRSGGRFAVFRQNGNALYKICEVYHERFSYSYAVDMLPAPIGIEQPRQCRALGRWPASFEIVADGVMGGSVHQQLFSFNDSYDLHVGPNQDVLLMMSIAVCVDRITHEIRRHR